MAKKKKDGRVNNGGYREGSGWKKGVKRKSYETKPVRVPLPILPQVTKLITDFKNSID